MTTFGTTQGTGFNFNSFAEIKSHSSILYNERMAILFYLLDMKSITLNSKYDVGTMLEVRSIILQIYKNIRTLLRNNPMVRATLNLETKDSGTYVTDVVLDTINRMVQYCEVNGYSTNKIYMITAELNKFEMIIKDILQYFSYFIRPDFKQKPDIEIATERYKEIADKKTIEELKQIVGKRHLIDFESLGSKRIELKREEEKDEVVDDLPTPEEISQEDDENT